MASHGRRVNGQLRQHSLQQLSSRRILHHHHLHHHHHHHHHQYHQMMRRQRSAEDERTLQIRASDQIADGKSNDSVRPSDRPKVRIAWGDEARTIDENSDGRVEVVACQVGTSAKSVTRQLANSRYPKICARASSGEKNCSTLLYSRQELAERLRLAWKQREANKSNIDVFLAHGITSEERSDSRLSSASSLDPFDARIQGIQSVNGHPERDETGKTVDRSQKKTDKPDLKIVDETKKKSFDTIDENRSSTIANSGGLARQTEISTPQESSFGAPNTPILDGAKAKRASFKSGTNVAFARPVNESNGAVLSQEISAPVVNKTKDPAGISAPEQRINRRTNSAPPLRRAIGATLLATRNQVNIVIDAPSIANKSEQLERSAQILAPSGESPNSSEENSTSKSLSSGSATIGRPVKSAPVKRRARSAKRRATNGLAAKSDNDSSGRPKNANSDAKNSEVVTMVSLVSDADSDTDIDELSPRDDKLISQLRSNLPTTPIIKSNGNSCGTLNSFARRPIKSVSFQQDSIEDREELDKRTTTLRIRPQSVQVGRVTGSALPTPEEARTWRTEVASLAISNISAGQHYENREITDVCLTDREKRCLIVPIGDPRSDKKRKLLRTRSTPPPRVNEIEKPTLHHMETKEVPPRTRVQTSNDNNVPAGPQSTSILLRTSVSKITTEHTVVMSRTESEPDLNVESVEPAFQTTKEKECWHLYRRMCDKGVCVSFDTVLRGMLTPTEYRLRKKESRPSSGIAES